MLELLILLIAHWHSLHMAHANVEDEMSNERRIGDVTEARSHNNEDPAGCFFALNTTIYIDCCHIAAGMFVESVFIW